MFAVTLCILITAAFTSADVRSEIDDVVKHLPMEDIAQILQKYNSPASAFRSDVRDVQPRSYNEVLNVFVENKAMQQIMEYFQRRGVDQSIEYILELTGDYLHGLNTESLSSIGPTVSGYFLADFIEALYASGFLEFVLEKKETSPELAKIIAALNDQEFKGLLYQAVQSFA